MRTSPRMAAVVFTAVLAMSGLSACTGSTGVAPSSSTSQEGSTVDLESVYDAVIAADPRVEDPLGTVSYSGAAQTLDLSVLIVGEEPVSTDTLTAILIAVRDSTPSSIQTVTVIAREAADSEKIVDISSAIAGLPEGLTPLYDGGVTLMRVDLDTL